MEELKLNSHIIHEIQTYIGNMDWAQQEYNGERLQIFLNGVRSALIETGVRFKLCREMSDNYRSQFYVLVEHYSDPYNCWSKIKHVCKIYANKIDMEQEENE